jgi:hypothetical protein
MAVARLLRAGQADFWSGQVNLGYPLFTSYHPLPALVMGTLTAFMDPWTQSMALFKLSAGVLWALMPFSWYLGARWLGLSRISSASAGALILTLRDFTGFGLGPESLGGHGLYTQTWGTFFLAPALGRIHLFCAGRRASVMSAASFLALTLLAHFFVGYICVIAAAVLTFAGGPGLRARLSRLGAALGVAFVLVGFWIIPFIGNIPRHGGWAWGGPHVRGYPLGDVFAHFIEGGFLDSGRFPWVTLLAAVGLVKEIGFSPRELSWGMVAVGALGFALFLGAATWGQIYTWLPLHRGLEPVRYVLAVQWAGLFFAAQGLTLMWSTMVDLLASARLVILGQGWGYPTLGTVTILGLMAWRVDRDWGVLKSSSYEAEEFNALADFLEKGRGRFYTHRDLGTGSQVLSSLLAAVSGRPHLYGYGRGGHDTASVVALRHFSMTREDCNLYNVRYVIANKGRSPGRDFLRLVFRTQAHDVYEFPEPQYFEFLRSASVASADPRRGEDLNADWLRREYATRELPALPHPNCPIRRPGTDVQAELSQSRVVEETHGLNRFTARVEVSASGGFLVLKASYHSNWKATLDGQPVHVCPMAPNMLGIHIPRGSHEVIFRYVTPPLQKVAFVLTIMAWVAAIPLGRILRAGRNAELTVGDLFERVNGSPEDEPGS